MKTIIFLILDGLRPFGKLPFRINQREMVGFLGWGITDQNTEQHKHNKCIYLRIEQAKNTLYKLFE
jgi:hypothetical protein